MNRTNLRQVLECGSALPLRVAPTPPESARALAHSKTLARPPRREVTKYVQPGWVQCGRCLPWRATGAEGSNGVKSRAGVPPASVFLWGLDGGGRDACPTLGSRLAFRAWTALLAVLGLGATILLGVAGAAETRPEVWRIDAEGAAICEWKGAGGQGCQLDMHGQGVMVHVEVPSAPEADLKMVLGWPILRGRDDLRGGIVRISRKDWPQLLVNGAAVSPGPRQSYRYDGVFTVQHRGLDGLRISCSLFPSVTQRAALEEWTVENARTDAVTVEIPSGRQTIATPTNALREASLLERTVVGIEKKSLAAGAKATWAIVHALRKASDPELAIDIGREKAARLALVRKARQTMVLQTPDPILDGTFALAKFRLLEAPVESSKGLIEGTGTSSYLGGIWANDNVEYAAPVCPYLGDATLQESCENMFRVWLLDKGQAISPSFETYMLRQVGHDRGDQAMMLYGLSSYLLALGKTTTAAEFWPLLLKAVRLTKAATRPDGAIASRTDELEGRYPTGKANLSTASLAYGGYRAAARLARGLGRTEEAADYQASAEAVANAIESYFGAEVEGYATYRYFDGCAVLRGWINLPLAMGIMKRKEGTLEALFSPKLWVEDARSSSAGSKVVSSDRGEGWPRETYYTLRAAFKAGDTARALEKTKLAVRYAMLSQRGPYMDEDSGDLLSPSVLYLSVITEGLFGIEPQSFQSFACTPRLPAEWPSMRLSNVCLMGRAVDLAVERSGAGLKVTVAQSGKTLSARTAPEGTTFEFDLSQAAMGGSTH
jgi:hypothetical protein